MKTKFRNLLPRAEVLLGVLLFFLLFEGPVLLYEWRLGQRLDFSPRPGALIFQFAALGYGAFRVLEFHPFYRASYRRWLEATPWKRGKPLPLGPIHLVWQDLVILCAIGELATQQAGLNPLRLLPLYLLSYLGLLGYTFFSTGARAYGYAVSFGLGLVTRLWHTTPLCAMTAVLVYMVAAFGLRQSLTAFPWDLKRIDESFARMRGKTATTPPPQEQLGWPYFRLGPKVFDDPTPGRLESVLQSLLAGWWFYSIGSLLPLPISNNAFFNLIIFISIGKTVTYINGYNEPLSVWGRFRTLRWIIKGYDQVFLAPLGCILVGLLAYAALQTWGFEHVMAQAISLTLALLVLLNLGPSLVVWRLTGEHRIVPGLGKSGQLYVEVD